MMKRWTRWLLCAFLCAGLLYVLAGTGMARADGLEVHFMDIGRNDGILIRCGGEDVFIDAGGYSRGLQATEYMRSVGVTKLKYYIGTHAHSDHVGGAPVIIAAFNPEKVIQPHDRVKEVILENIRSTPQKAVVPTANYVNMTVGEKISVGGATLTCLGPVSIRKIRPTSGYENDNSLVLMLTYGEIDILLSADATSTSLSAIEAANPGCLKADIYKNAHHNEATRKDLFALIQPEYTIFSTAKRNMPSSKYLQTLNEFGSRALLTSPNHSGHIILRTDGQTYNFETQYAAQGMTLKQEEISVYEGKKATIKVTMEPYNHFKALLYTSSDPSVATVDGSGKITGVGMGEAVITVSDGSGLSASCRVTVKPAVMTLRKTELSVKQHSRVKASWKIEPSGSKPVITWATQDPAIATVDEKGRITGVYPGVTTITATMPSGQVSAITVTVKPISVSRVTIKPSSTKLTIGESRTMTASVSPKKATWPEVTWSSADESIVTIDRNGTLKAVGVGKTTITATTREGKSRTAKITVKPLYVKKIMLTADQTEGLIGGVAGRNQVKLSYAVEPANATIQQMKWSSSNKKIATVDENGVVTGHKAGKVTITCRATDGSGRYARIKLTFGANELKRTVAPVEGELAVQASRIRYVSGQLEVRMTYVNRTGEKQQIPQHGLLMLVTPEGEQIPLMQIADRQTLLKNRSTKTYKYCIPLSANPKLGSLDLTRCDAVVITRQ